MRRLTASKSPLVATLAALDATNDPSACGGEWAPSSPIALRIPGEPELVIDAQQPDRCVAALLAHAEPAPFGDGQRTRTDPAVRDAFRLTARDAVRVQGFDPTASGVLAAIERALSPREHLAATLTDVHVYPPGGHFRRHRDTPRGPGMLGTLVVCLPIPHRGGALSVSSCDANPMVFDWSTDPAHSSRALRWAAMFGDADHSVAAVEEGHRVTVTYALRLTGEARAPADDRAAPFRDALLAALRDREFMPDGGVLLVPCAHHVIAPTNADAAHATRDLRGLDRDLAEAAVALGIIVGVRPCLAITEMRDQRKPPAEPFVHALDVARLKRALSDQTIGALGEYVTFARKGRDDDGEDVDAFSLASALFRGEATDAFTVRPRACATLIHETCFSFDGCFGNEHFDAWMYAAVAIELSIPTQKERGVAPPEPAGRRVRHAKFGAGTVTDEGPPGDDGVLTIRFDADGVVKRLQRKFVVDVC